MAAPRAIFRARIGIHHHIAGSYLLRYAQESSWREDNCRQSNGEQLNRRTSTHKLINIDHAGVSKWAGLIVVARRSGMFIVRITYI
jgi:hypothetical protein